MPPIIRQITTANNDFQRADVLKHNRNKRQRYKQFFVEGVRSINAAVKFDWSIDAFIYCPEKSLSDWAKGILKASKAKTHLELTTELMAELSDKEEPSELLAIVEIPDDDLNRIPVKDNFLLVVFDRPASPGNLGTSIRSCDVFGAAGIVITGHAVDLYHPHTVRGSMGSLFSTPCVRLESQNELIPWLEKIRLSHPKLQIVGTSPESAIDLGEHDLSAATVLIMGNETFGMSQAYDELCDYNLKIPMYGTANSLNVSCACSIFLYEIQKQRQR